MSFIIAVLSLLHIHVSLLNSPSPHTSNRYEKVFSSCNNVDTEVPHKQPPSVFIIGWVGGGGAQKYLDDIMTHFGYAGIKFKNLDSMRTILSESRVIRRNDILLFQYLAFTDITMDAVRDLVVGFGLRLVIPVHDLYLLAENVQHRTVTGGGSNNWMHFGNFTVKGEMPQGRPRELLELAEAIIFPSAHVYDIFRKHLTLETMKVVPHIDLLAPYKECMPSVRETVNIGIISTLTEVKGEKVLSQLIHDVNVMRDANGHNGACFDRITFHLYGEQLQSKIPLLSNVISHPPYKEGEIFDQLVHDEIHGLLLLNCAPETYSYALTKAFESGLPILYTDIGAVGERVKERAVAVNKESMYIGTNNDDIFERFLELVSIICGGKHMDNVPCKNLPPGKKPLHIPRFYEKLFFGDSTGSDRRMKALQCKHQAVYSQIHQSLIEPYAIYFPQFHAVPENNLNFYPGFTDMVNLVSAKQSDPLLLTPDRSLLGFYDLERDREIVPIQIELAKSYGFAGFAVYYYWFSTNTVTNEHPVFKAVIDRFFQEPIPNFSVFFVFCNEGWTSNVAFQTGASTHEIVNKYDEVSLKENFDYLVTYFKHDNYRKIENRPVLFLHHPGLMTESELLLFEKVGGDVARANGFAGIVVALNNWKKDPVLSGFEHYATHPQYKSERAAQFTQNKQIDYNYYVRKYLPWRSANMDTVDSVNSMFVNFDNTPRFFTHENSGKFITKTKNNDIPMFEAFLESQFKMYVDGKPGTRSGSVARMFIVNSWNEWGEQMALEPSQEMGFAYLESFQRTLLTMFGN